MTEKPKIQLRQEKRVVIRWQNPVTGEKFHSEFVSTANDLTILTYCHNVYQGRRRRLLNVSINYLVTDPSKDES
jgi:hypothetical protein